MNIREHPPKRRKLNHAQFVENLASSRSRSLCFLSTATTTTTSSWLQVADCPPPSSDYRPTPLLTLQDCPPESLNPNRNRSASACPQPWANTCLSDSHGPYDGSRRRKFVCVGTIHIEAALARTAALKHTAFRVSYQFGQLSLPTVQDGPLRRSVTVGKIPSQRDNQILANLCEAQDIHLEFFCHRQKVASGWLLANIYTSPARVATLGTYFDQLGLFLQDPTIYEAEALYQNPHLLSYGENDQVMLSTLKLLPATEHFAAPTNIFDDLIHTDRLPETETPTLLSTALLSHQKQALYFMQHRECQTPSGGLLADQMGLGKTLQMISLIASDFDARPIAESGQHGHAVAHATLVVAPLTLLRTWQGQFLEHVRPHSMRVHVHHGADRATKFQLAVDADVVLSTYDVVVAEFRRSQASGNQSLIYSRRWRRVVLDEAHYIRNPTALRTNAVISIESMSKWAVSGTPIQNRLTDLGALFRFLRAAPYDDLDTFRRDIIRPWKSKSDPGAAQRLRDLIRKITIRRTKDLLDLPHREDRIHQIDLSAEESALYEHLRGLVQTEILTADPSMPASSPHILRWIDRLREFCSRGGQYELLRMQHTAKERSSPTPINGLRNSHGTLHREAEGAPSSAGFVEDFFADGDLSEDPCVHLEDCDQQRDSFVEAASSYLSPPEFPWSSLSPATPLTAISSPVSAAATPQSGSEAHLLPTKIRALLEDIRHHNGQCVVFSYWRSSLDVVGRAMTATDLNFVRVDGSLNQAEREAAITTFRESDHIKVMLATISVAAEGLDLTVANLACLLEPQWNPSVEEQALSRVHRMRQMRPVTTIRYVVKHSIEGSIIELQKRKLRLAQLALSGETTTPPMNVLEELKHLI